MAEREEDWVEVTSISDSHQVQARRTVAGYRYRHRPLRFGAVPGRHRFGEERGAGDWVDGRPPSGPHAPLGRRDDDA